jgi:hypothetical protein
MQMHAGAYTCISQVRVWLDSNCLLNFLWNW